MNDRWIVIPGWDKFQHYGNREPVWIKVYTELMSRAEWCSLTDAQCGVLVKVWLEYARSGGVLSVGRMLTLMHRSSRSSALKTLNDAGFIGIVASKPQRHAHAREVEKEEEKEGRKDGRASAKKNRKGVTGWRIVRGSHGMSTIPDPNGTDPAPTIGRPL